MNVVITGHTGFIGSNLMQRLESKHSILGYSKSTGGDIMDRKKLGNAMKECDIIYHLAAYADPAGSFFDPVDCIGTNVGGTLNVLEECRSNDRILVFASSCEIYGDCAMRAKESDAFRTTNPYAASKSMCDTMCETYRRAYGMDIRIARLFNPYGPGQQMNKIIPAFWKQAKDGKPITVYGDGSDYRDYTYIDDITAGFEMMMFKANVTANFCTGTRTTTMEIADKINSISGNGSEIKNVKYPDNHGGIRYQVGDNREAKRILGWEPKINFDEGLRRTIEWLEKR